MSVLLYSSGRAFRATLAKYLKGQVAGGYADNLPQTIALLEAAIAALETDVEDLNDLYWDDLRFPAQGINPAGSIAPPSVNTTDGLLDFAGTVANNIIAGVAQLPHAWKEGGELRPHIHLKHRNAAAGNSVWQLEYDIANVNEDFAETYTAVTATLASPRSTKRHSILGFGSIPVSWGRDSVCMLWRITRLQDNGSDNFGFAIGLVEFDIHYQSDGRGSSDEYPTGHVSTAAFTLTAAGTGTVQVSLVSTGSFAVAASGAGAVRVSGTSTGAFSLAAAGTGVQGADGASAQLFWVSGPATWEEGSGEGTVSDPEV